MASLNKVQIIGNLGKDPDVRYMPSGGAVCTFSLATNEKWKDKQSGEQMEKVEWHRIVLFGRVAEVAAEYLKKGSSCYVEGKLQTRKWQNKEGKDQWTTEIVGFTLQLLGSKSGSGPPHPGEGGSKTRPQTQGQPPLTDPFDSEGNVDTSGAQPPPGDFDDDIPF